MTDSVRILALQTRRKSIADSLDYLQSDLAPLLKARETDFVVLPEKWITDTLDEGSRDLLSLISFLETISESAGCTIVPGSISVRRRDGLFNSSPVIHRGKLLGWQDKISLFRVEKENYSAGREAKVFDIDGIRITVSICYDSDFPYYARMAAMRGSELMINPALIHGDFHDMWKIYVQARSLENRLPFISVNSVSEPFRGNSMLVVPEKYLFGAKLSTRIFGDQEIILSDMSLEGLKELREERLAEDPGSYGFK